MKLIIALIFQPRTIQEPRETSQHVYLVSLSTMLVTKFIDRIAAQRSSPYRSSKRGSLSFDSITGFDGNRSRALCRILVSLVPWQRVLQDRSIVQRPWILRLWNCCPVSPFPSRLSFSVRSADSFHDQTNTRHIRGSIVDRHRSFRTNPSNRSTD